MVNFCAVLGFSNRCNRKKDKGYGRIAAVVSRSKPKKHALSVKRRATWLARIRREDLAADATAFNRVCGDHSISGMLLGVRHSLQGILFDFCCCF